MYGPFRHKVRNLVSGSLENRTNNRVDLLWLFFSNLKISPKCVEVSCLRKAPIFLDIIFLHSSSQPRVASRVWKGALGTLLFCISDELLCTGSAKNPYSLNGGRIDSTATFFFCCWRICQSIFFVKTNGTRSVSLVWGPRLNWNDWKMFTIVRIIGEIPMIAI